MIIDQWVSLGASNPSGNIDLRSAYYYDALVDYKYQTGCISGACLANAILQWLPNGGIEKGLNLSKVILLIVIWTQELRQI